MLAILPQVGPGDKAGIPRAGRRDRHHSRHHGAAPAFCYSENSIMAVDPELLAILACPACKTPVELVDDGAGLKCASCRRVFPIKDDIPVMLIDEAAVDP